MSADDPRKDCLCCIMGGNVHYCDQEKTASTPPPDAQAMTREQVEEKLEEFGDQELMHGLEHKFLLAHDAAQRETIRRLEQELVGKERAGTVLVEKISELNARLTASEAKHKWTTQPTHDGWHWWRRPYGKKILVTIVRVKKNWGNGKLYVYAGKRTEDCKGSWQGPLTPGEE